MERADAERSDRAAARRSSAPSACSSPDGCARSTSRRGEQHEHAFAASRRSANASALADEASSHCTSSIATRSGFRGAAAGALRVAIPSARAIDRVFVRLVAEERDLERTPPRCRERGQYVVEDVVEEIPKADVREPALGLGRSRREDTHTPRTRVLDAGEPERRLPDTRFALEHERSRPSLRSGDESAEESEFLVSADDLGHHLPEIVREVAGKGNLALRHLALGLARARRDFVPPTPAPKPQMVLARRPSVDADGAMPRGDPRPAASIHSSRAVG